MHGSARNIIYIYKFPKHSNDADEQADDDDPYIHFARLLAFSIRHDKIKAFTFLSWSRLSVSQLLFQPKQR